MTKINLDEITITITDENGNTFSRDWKDTEDNRDAIRWTLQSEDLKYKVDISKIVDISVRKTTSGITHDNL